MTMRWKGEDVMMENVLLRVLKPVRRPIQRCARIAYPWFVRLLPVRIDVSHATHWVIIELTSKCNLRCVYCGKSSDPEENGRVFDFPEEQVLPAIHLLQKRQLRLVQVSGIGETTTRKGWHQICRDTLNTGIAHTIITNLARPLLDDEADTLARFDSVQVSIDTADPDLFSQIRRGARLTTVLANIERIQASARKRGMRGPELRFDMVVTDKTVQGLPETVELGLRHGATDFCFAGLIKHKDVTNGINVYQVKTLPRPRLEEALHCLERAVSLAQTAGCKVAVYDGLIEGIRTGLAKADGESRPSELGSEIHRWDAPRLDQGWTRDCLDPWSMVFLYAHGQVRPCCCYDKAIGDLTKSSLRDIMNGSTVREMRRNLLAAKLDGTMCAQCSMRSPIRIEDFRKKVKGFCVRGFVSRHLGQRITKWVSRA